MSRLTLVYLNFSFSMPVEDYLTMHQHTAEIIATQPGLLWKIWKLDRETRRGGGVYIFDDRSHAESYISGPLIEKLRSQAGIHNLVVDIAEVIDNLSSVTRAPL